MMHWHYILALAFIATLSRTNANDCLPLNTTNLLVHGRQRNSGNSITIECLDRTYPDRRVYCNSNGNWAWMGIERTPCPPPKCRKAPNVGDENAIKINHGGIELGDTVNFTCRPGMVGKPLNTISFRCEKRRRMAKWIALSRQPNNKRVKTIQCQSVEEHPCSLDVDPNRQVDEEYSELEHGTHNIVPGDEVYFTCSPGYRISDDEAAYCDDDGKWDISLPRCEMATCNLLGRTWNNFRSKPDISRTFYNGEQVSFECEDNFRIHPYGSDTLKCTDGIRHGGWHAQVPVCRRVTCTRPSTIDHGHATIHPAGPFNNISVGSILQVSCNDGYTLEGSIRRTCTPSGSWDGHLQVCIDETEETTCQDPGHPIGGTKLGTGYNLGDLVTFTCSHGYKIMGSKTRKCQSSGQWSGDETKCYGLGQYPTDKENALRLQSGMITMSSQSVSSRIEQEKVKGLYGKAITYGTTNMRTVSESQRSTIAELQNGNIGLDTWFVLDTSGSVRAHVNDSIDIIKYLVKELKVDNEEKGTAVGFMAFDQEVWHSSAVGDFESEAEVFAELEDVRKQVIDRTYTDTNTASALSRLSSLIGTRTIQLAGKKRTFAIIMLTDGKTNQGKDPLNPRNTIVTEAAKNGYEVHVYIIGVGNADTAELQQLTTPGAEYLIYAADYDTVKETAVMLFSNNTDYQRCGIMGKQDEVSSEPSIVFAKHGVWRWTVGIYESINNDFQSLNIENSRFVCGGSLLSRGPKISSSNWVLTAAHCVNDDHSYIVKLGSVNSTINVEGEVPMPLIVKVTSRSTPNNYNGTTKLNDIALLQLEDSVPFSHDIRPVCLHGPNDVLPRNHRAFVTGWGYWGGTTITENLKQMTMKVETDNQACQTFFNGEKQKNHFKHEAQEYGKNFCAGGLKFNGNFIDACKKDSGSPLVVCEDSDKEDDDNRKVCKQLGLVSFGLPSCDGKYGIFTNVTTYYDWIHQRIGYQAG